MNIMIYTRKVYGKTLIYPDSQVDALMQLTGKKTLDRRDLVALVELGHTIEHVDDPGDGIDELEEELTMSALEICAGLSE